MKGGGGHFKFLVSLTLLLSCRGGKNPLVVFSNANCVLPDRRRGFKWYFSVRDLYQNSYAIEIKNLLEQGYGLFC